ncbi:MAG: preprotein translocase subunit SecG [bacterium]
MATVLMVLFILLCLFLSLFILIQQGKGDMGLGSLGGGTQLLFGGSGGQSFFEKATWIMGFIFIFGALGISILKSKEHGMSRLKDITIQTKTQKQVPQNNTNTPQKINHTNSEKK